MEVYDDESSEGNERMRGVEHALLNCVSRALDCQDGADKGSETEACIQKAWFVLVSRPEKNGGSRISGKEDII